MEAKRESTKARCYNFLAMNCDGALKSKAKGHKEAYLMYRMRIDLLCEILKINLEDMWMPKVVKKYRPDLFEQSFYDDIRRFVA